MSDQLEAVVDTPVDQELLSLVGEFFASLKDPVARAALVAANSSNTLFCALAGAYEQSIAEPQEPGTVTEITPNDSGFVNLTKPGDFAMLGGALILRVNGRGVHKRKAPPQPGNRLEAPWLPTTALTVSGGVEVYEALSRNLPGCRPSVLKGSSIKAKENGWALRIETESGNTVLTFPAGVYQILKEIA